MHALSEKLITGMAHLLVDFLLIWMILGRMGNRGKAKEIGDGRVEFAPDWIAFSGWVITAAYLSWLSVRGWMHNHSKPFDLLPTVVITMVVLILVLEWPGTLVTSCEGVRQVFWFRKNKCLRWDEITEIELNGKISGYSSLKLRNAKGLTIAHSGLLGGREEFIAEIQRYCDEQLPPEFPRVNLTGKESL